MKNPILQDIKREYPLAYEMATQACSVLQDISPNPIKEDEIGYIAVSFALALERQKAKEWAPKKHPDRLRQRQRQRPAAGLPLPAEIRQEFGPGTNL